MIIFSSHGRAAEQLPVPSGRGDDEPALAALAEIGVLRRMPGDASWIWAGPDPDADRRLLGLLSKFDLHVEIFPAEDETAWLALLVWEPDAASGSAHAGAAFTGTGFAAADAVRSCLGEFAEFQSWLYRAGDGGRRCHRNDLGDKAVDPWRVLGFSDPQRQRWRELNDGWRGYESVPDPSTFEGEIDWTRCTRLGDGAECWLPSQLCHGRYAERAAHSRSAWRSDSNGCAAGRTDRHALTSALLELIERDATGIWWYGRCPRPAVPRARLANAPLQAALENRSRRGHHVHLLDLTHDLGISVVAAILLDSRGSISALGFGCGADHGRAAASAYLEMCQMEISVALVRQRAGEAKDTASPEDRRLLTWLSQANVRELPHLTPAGEASIAATYDEASPDTILPRLSRAGLGAYAVDLRRPDIGIPAMRAFVPGLCHFKPRLGFPRLIDVPRALGWREAGFGADDLSALPLLI